MRTHGIDKGESSRQSESCRIPYHRGGVVTSRRCSLELCEEGRRGKPRSPTGQREAPIGTLSCAAAVLEEKAWPSEASEGRHLSEMHETCVCLFIFTL